MEQRENVTQPGALLPGLVLALAVLLAIAGFSLFLLNRHTVVPPSWGAAGGARTTGADLVNALQAALSVGLAGGIGFLVLRRRVAQTVGYLLMGLALFNALSSFGVEYGIYGYYTRPGLPAAQIVAWAGNWMWLVIFSDLILLVALFPDGRFVSNRWRRLALGATALFAVPLFLGSSIEREMSSAFGIINPFFNPRLTPLYTPLFYGGVIFMPIAVAAVVAPLLVRFGNSWDRQRHQIKWFFFGGTLMLAFTTGGLLLSFSGHTVGEILVNMALWPPLLGMGVALLRHRLYDIDIIVRRTLVYSVVSAILALVYFSSVVLLQQLFVAIAGQQTPLAIVISTLLIAALFNPLRRRIQAFIDQRFYRRQYDAVQMLAHFAEVARDEVEMEALTSEIARIISHTVQPETVSVWLQPETGREKRA